MPDAAIKGESRTGQDDPSNREITNVGTATSTSSATPSIDLGAESIPANEPDLKSKDPVKIFKQQLQSDEFNSELSEGHRITNVDFLRASVSIVYAVTLANGENAILKFPNPNNEMCERYGTPEQHYGKLEWCYSQMQERGNYQAEEVIESGSTTIGDQAFVWILEKKLEGSELKEDELVGPGNETLTNELWEETGRIAASINSIETTGYGLIYDPSTESFTQTWNQFLDGAIEIATSDELVELGLLREDQQASVREIANKNLGTLDKRYPRALNHRDLGPTNNILFLEAEEDQLKVTGVLDFDSASSLPGQVWEIAAPLFHQTMLSRDIRFDKFLTGLGITENEYESTGLRQDVESALLLELCSYLKIFDEGSRSENPKWQKTASKGCAQAQQRIGELIDKLG